MDDDLAALLEHVPVAIARITTDGQVVFSNAASRALLGDGSQQELDDGAHADAFAADPGTRERFDAAFAAAAAGEPATFEGDVRTSAGAMRVLVRLAPVGDGPAFVATATEDVTDRHRALRLLETSQQIARLGSWSVRDGRLTCTPELRRLLRLPARAGVPELLGAVHPGDRDRVEAEMRAAAAAGEPYIVRHRIRPAGGKEVVVVSRGWLRLDDRGVVAAGEGTAQDVTDLVRLEQRAGTAEDAQRRLQAVIDGSPQTIYAKTPDGRLLFLNAAGRAALSVPGGADVAGRRPTDLGGDPGAADHFDAQDREVLETGVPSVETRRVTLPGGSKRHFRIQKHPLRDADGHAYAVCGMATDVTEVVRAQEQEHEAERRRALVAELATTVAGDAAPEAVHLAAVRCAAAGTGRSAALVRLGGAEAPELLAAEGLRPAALDVLGPVVAAALRGEAPPPGTGPFAVPVGDADGALALVLGPGPASPASGEADLVAEAARLVAIADARRRAADLEAQLARAQRLESVGKLAGGVAHDFNNLLAVILNAADFALEVAEDPQQREDLEEVKRAGERAAELTRQLLAFGRAQADPGGTCHLNDVVGAAAGTLLRTLGVDAAADLALDPTAGEAAIGAGDLQQVLVALAVNAREAMPGGGRIRIATRRVDGAVELRVADTGAGMTPEVADRALEPFFSTKDAAEGSGLGLSTVHGLVTRAGGTVTIETAPGAGTTVRVRLPAAGAPSAVPAPADGPAGGATVLVVEDEAAVRGVVQRILQGAGHRVLVADSAEQGRGVAAAEGPIDLLLTDVVMPGESGLELAETLPGGHAVLLMSGYADEVARRRGGLPAGAGFVEKPFTADRLLEAVAAALHRR